MTSAPGSPSRDAPAVERAIAADVPAIRDLIADSAEFGLMLPKSLAWLYEHLPSFRVIRDHQAYVIGCCGLSIVWADLAEVVSLAVAKQARGQGLGKLLVQAVLDDAHALGVRRVMTLTYEQAFFEKLGFESVERSQLPMKVWADCVHCPKHDACDETAMMRVFDDLAPATAPPAGLSAGVMTPPVQLTATIKKTLT
ncbi:MAG: N-acetyltransferase [Planctomycetota bacterium]